MLISGSRLFLMASGNALEHSPDAGGITSGNGSGRRARPIAPAWSQPATMLTADADQVLADYAAALERAPLALASRGKYLSRVRGLLAWLAHAAVDGDPLADPAARDWAVRDYRAHLKAIRKSSPATINTTLAALGDFYQRRGLGAPAARREDVPQRDAPRALGEREARRFLRAVEQEPSVRDRLVALLPYFAGLRDSEVVRLDVDDVRLSARKGELRVLGKGSDSGSTAPSPSTPSCAPRSRPGSTNARAGRPPATRRRCCSTAAAAASATARCGRSSSAWASWLGSATTRSSHSARTCSATPSAPSWCAPASTWSRSLS
jgi:hypothetical protein